MNKTTEQLIAIKVLAEKLAEKSTGDKRQCYLNVSEYVNNIVKLENCGLSNSEIAIMALELMDNEEGETNEHKN